MPCEVVPNIVAMVQGVLVRPTVGSVLLYFQPFGYFLVVERYASEPFDGCSRVHVSYGSATSTIEI